MRNLNEVKEAIKQKPWFKATRYSLQQELLSLGEECIGFLTELEARPKVISGVRVISLEGILIPDVRPIFGIFAYFKVQRTDNLEVVYHYQYFTWRQGSESGSKGVLLVENDDCITHVILNQGEKFSTGFGVYDVFGGFGEPNDKFMENVLTNFQKEICEELGMSKLTIKEIVTLGRLLTDAGMTNNAPQLFAAVIDGKEAAKISEGDTDNPDVYELGMGTVIVPVERLGEFIDINDDGYFHACLLRYANKRGTFSLNKPKKKKAA